MKNATAGAAGEAAKPMTRREKERLAHRAAILDAAERVFAAKGFPGATIAEIAREAEFAVGSIYNFFPGKRELAEAVMLRIATERVEEVEREVLPLAAASGAAGLRAFVRVWVRHHATHGPFLRMGMEYQRSQGHREPPEAFKRLFREYRAASERFFAEGLRAGLYRAIPAADLVRTFEGLAHEYLFEWDRAPADARPSAAKLEERLFAVLSKLLLA